ncbi:MAG: hypothetical protein LBV08_07965 [Clostridiales bacterium]|jgi:hypothetical protein|nr:hypothetical protein [Clostridiales bacterium]
MKKNKAVSAVIALAVMLSLTAAGTYAWFITQHESQSVDVSTGTIDACVSAFSRPKENLLPSEVHEVDLHPTSISNSGSRDMVVKFSIGDVSKAHLKEGQVPTDDLKSDYTLGEDGLWYLTKERLMEVAQFDMIDMSEFFPWEIIDGNYYAYIPARQNYYVGRGQVTILPELGGNVLQADETNTVDRQFEHGASLSVANSILGVQNTKQACDEIFGTDIASKFPDSWFE